jgi:hypothetical protein
MAQSSSKQQANFEDEEDFGCDFGCIECLLYGPCDVGKRVVRGGDAARARLQRVFQERQKSQAQQFLIDIVNSVASSKRTIKKHQKTKIIKPAETRKEPVVVKQSRDKTEEKQRKPTEKNTPTTFQDCHEMLVDLEQNLKTTNMTLNKTNNQLNQLKASNGYNKQQRIQVAHSILRQSYKKRGELEEELRITLAKMRELKEDVDLREECSYLKAVSSFLNPVVPKQRRKNAKADDLKNQEHVETSETVEKEEAAEGKEEETDYEGEAEVDEEDECDIEDEEAPGGSDLEILNQPGNEPQCLGQDTLKYQRLNLQPQHPKIQAVQQHPTQAQNPFQHPLYFDYNSNISSDPTPLPLNSFNPYAHNQHLFGSTSSPWTRSLSSMPASSGFKQSVRETKPNKIQFHFKLT